MSHTLTIRLEHGLVQQVEAAARQRGLAKSAFIRQAIIELLAKRNPRRFNLLLDLAGSIDGPADSSTRRKEHFRRTLIKKHGSHS